jgi:hypothetical protein
VYDAQNAPKAAPAGRVAARLGELAQHYGFSFVNRVALTRGLVTASIDHVIVDRYGVLLVDVEQYEGAAIRGSDTGNQWAATFPDGQVTEFRNPLYLSAGNENLARQALSDRSIVLEPGQIRGAVLFVGADTSQLSLVEVSALKVRTLEHIVDMFEARYNSPPNSGQLTAPDIAHIVSVIGELTEAAVIDEEQAGSWHSDPAVIASTQAALSVPPPPPSRADEGMARPAELAGHLSGVSAGPSARAAFLTVGTILLIVLALVAGILFLPQLQSGSPLAWTAALVLFVGIAELVSANIAAAPGNARKARGPGSAGGVARFVVRLLLVFAFVAVCWLFVAGGVGQRLGDMIGERFNPTSRGSVTSSGQPISPAVVAAKRRLREKAPQVYDSALDLNSPQVSTKTDGSTAYTWSYVPPGLSASQAASFTLTIGANGQVISTVPTD